jgi:hypothetical protein
LTAVNGTLGIELARATLPAGDPDGHQPAGHQRHRSLENPARRPGHGAHPRRCPERQCHAARHREGLEAGFFRYLTKPIKVKEFMDTLNAALEFARKSGQQSKAGQTP